MEQGGQGGGNSGEQGEGRGIYLRGKAGAEIKENTLFLFITVYHPVLGPAPI